MCLREREEREKEHAWEYVDSPLWRENPVHIPALKYDSTLPKGMQQICA